MPELTIREKAAAAVRCQSAVLESGLTVLCRTMPGYSTVHAMYATPFGSTVRDFVLDGRPVHLPAGTAHFLEHKMFESEQGDAFSLYAKTGAVGQRLYQLGPHLLPVFGHQPHRREPGHPAEHGGQALVHQGDHRQGAGHHRAGDQNVRRQPRLAAAHGGRSAACTGTTPSGTTSPARWKASPS